VIEKAEDVTANISELAAPRMSHHQPVTAVLDSVVQSLRRTNGGESGNGFEQRGRVVSNNTYAHARSYHTQAQLHRMATDERMDIVTACPDCNITKKNPSSDNCPNVAHLTSGEECFAFPLL